MTRLLFVAFGGVLGNPLSNGLDDVGLRVAKLLGCSYRRYAWNQGARAAREAAGFDGLIVTAFHSAGKSANAEFMAELGREIALSFSIDAWLPAETVSPLIKRVYSIKAGRGGRFHVEGPNVVEQITYPDETHISIDDEPILHDFMLEKIGDLMNAQLPVVAQSEFNTVLSAYQNDWRNFMDPAQETPKQAAWQKVFFDEVRGSVFKPLNQSQIDGLKTMVWTWRRFFSDNPVEFFASVAGQAVRETGGRMRAIRETNADSDAEAVNKLQAWWDSGKAWKFGVRSQYWKFDGVGHPFGRGIFQLTLRDNYIKGDALLYELLEVDTGLSVNYALALDPLISALMAFGGSIEGTFREHKLADFAIGDGFDFFNARDVTNGDKNNTENGQKIGRVIERDSKVFLKALRAAEIAAPGWLAMDVDLALVPPAPPMPVPAGDLTLENLRTWTEADLLAASVAAADFIKLSLIVRQERETSVAGIPTAQPIAVDAAEKEGTKDMLFTKTKSLLKSKTIIGIVGALVATFVPASKPVLDVFMPETSGFDPEVIKQLLESARQTVESLRTLAQTVSLAFAAYGRKVADTKI